MKKWFVLLLLCWGSAVWAQPLPPILVAGFEKYQDDGAKAAIIAWIKGSAIDNSQDAIAQSNQLNLIEDYYGAYEGYDLFKSNPLGPRAHLYLVTLNYGKGLVYAKFFTYKTSSGEELIQSFNFNTEVDKIWPAFMVYNQ